jgi:hypothetical protein
MIKIICKNYINTPFKLYRQITILQHKLAGRIIRPYQVSLFFKTACGRNNSMLPWPKFGILLNSAMFCFSTFTRDFRGKGQLCIYPTVYLYNSSDFSALKMEIRQVKIKIVHDFGEKCVFYLMQFQVYLYLPLFDWYCCWNNLTVVVCYLTIFYCRSRSKYYVTLPPKLKSTEA